VTLELRETCRVVRGGVPLWRYHRARMLAAGCETTLVDAVEKAAFAEAARHDVAPSTRVRLNISVRGSAFEIGSQRRLSSLDVPNRPVIARVDIAEKPTLPPAAAKPLDRSLYDAAHRAARAAGAHQAVLVDPDGFVVDGSTATVLIAENGLLITPPAPPAIAGVARAVLLGEGEAEGLRVAAQPVSWERLEAADEVILCNAVRGAVGVRGRSGEIAHEVEALFARAWAGARA
jgi:branched-subunit amino acid aminotransferase/4-amino-4-deoxychorismate lyase